MNVTLTVNGTEHTLDVPDNTLLVDVLRGPSASRARMWAATPANAAPA